MTNKQLEIKLFYFICLILLLIFLVVPVLTLLQKSFLLENNSWGWQHFTLIFSHPKLITCFKNSLLISMTTAVLATLCGFLLAYTVNMTHIPEKIKQTLHLLIQFPMLLPTITYGFVIIYTFGKQGLLTQLLGKQFLTDIYGVKGLLIGYVLYTLPICYLLINNAFKYLDKKTILVSITMQDKIYRRFWTTLFLPLLSTFIMAIIQAFLLMFTDYGIPAAVGGRFEVVSTLLYQEILGSNPSFTNGAIISIMMLLPSIICILLLQYFSRHNAQNHMIHNPIKIKSSLCHDAILGILSTLIIVMIMGIFAVMFIAPFSKNWPYNLSFDSSSFREIFRSNSDIQMIYCNSLIVAIFTALIGTVITFLSAICTTRSKLSQPSKQLIQALVILSNTIPGMVLGISYLLFFSSSSLHNTLLILIFCNVIHFFSTPYLMSQDALSKMNTYWESVSRLMGDNWFKTLFRIIIPNAKMTLWQVFSYIFINSMVTISAVIFITSSQTMLLTTKIKELQHFAKFEEIFILSMMILSTNLLMLAFIYLVKNFSISRCKTYLTRRS